MTEPAFHRALLAVSLAIAAVAFPVLFFLTAPYGRHGREGWGPKIGERIGWVLMEAPSPILMAVFFAIGDRRASPAAIAFLALWEIHYVNRTFVFPFRRPGAPKLMPLAVVAMGFAFNLTNAYLNGRWLFAFGPDRPASWLADPRFLGGAALFAAGLVVNLQSDAILMRLRRPGETGYKIPSGGLYRFVSCPNYLGEILEWTGFAIATWSPTGLAFALWTAANLVPRARSNHRWYRETFPDYPPERRAIVPFVY
jgi:3-oxo-5-alpha-steroid 4-dehydrogenase 1